MTFNIHIFGGKLPRTSTHKNTKSAMHSCASLHTFQGRRHSKRVTWRPTRPFWGCVLYLYLLRPDDVFNSLQLQSFQIY